MAQRDEFIVLLKIGKGQGGRPSDGFQRRVPRPFELFREGRKLLLRWRLVESPDTDVDRVDFPPAKKSNNLVPRLFQL